MFQKKLFATLLISALVITGCVMKTGRTDIKDEDVNQFVVGKSTYQDVIQKLGKPNVDKVQKMVIKGKDMSQHIVVYDMSSVETKISGASFIPVIGSFVGKQEVNSTMKTHTFIFDPKTDVLVNFSTTDLGGTNSKAEGWASGSLGKSTTDGQTTTGMDMLMGGSDTRPTSRSISQ